MSLISNVYGVITNNQILATGLGLSGAGILTFWIKDVPRSIYKLLKRELTTELIITSSNISFHNILKWIEKNYTVKNFRKLKMTNGKWGEDRTTTSIGYGLHFIKYRTHHFIIELIKDSSNQTERDRETLIITKMGRGRKVFDEFINEVETLDYDLTKTKLYKMERCWVFIKDQRTRNFDSIFIEKSRLESLLRNLDKFITSEEWYINNGIPYQLGILLYGPPGTGKTSLIKAIAGYLNYSIYYLSPENLGNIELAMCTIADKSLVVIEDIDSNFLTHARSHNHVNKLEDIDINAPSLSEVLNSLDGMFSSHGRILVATTNHIEDLDPALIRPGRIDLKVNIDYVNKDVLKDFSDMHFSQF